MSETETRIDAATWFEIPATDFERATAFYEAVLGAALRRETMMGEKLAVLPYQPPGLGGAVVQRAGHQPAEGGVLVYLNCAGRLDAAIAAATAAGGALAMPKLDLPPGMGTIAHVRDPEGNRVGLHAP